MGKFCHFLTGLSARHMILVSIIISCFYFFFQKAQVDSEACSNRENEVLGLLQHIVTECNTIVLQMKQTLKLRHDQLQAKQLRSRQRDNLKKLLCW